MRLSIIIPVYKEGKNINEHILHLKKQMSGKIAYEIIVSDGEHSTLELIEDKSIIKVKSTKGRGNSLIDGINSSNGDVLVFIHSDTKMPQNFDQMIIDKIKRGCEIGAFNLGIDSKKFIFRIIEKTASLRSKITKIPYGDQSIFCTRNSYQIIGGFDNYPLMEDVSFMIKAKKHKLTIGFINEKVFTSARRWENEGVIYVTIRNWILVSLFYLGVSPFKLVNWYTNFKNLVIFNRK